MSNDEAAAERATEPEKVILLPEDDENLEAAIFSYSTGPELYAMVDLTPEKADAIAAGLTAWAKIERAKLAVAAPSSAEEAPADGR